MKIKTKISFVLALLIVVSTFTVIDTTQGDEGGDRDLPIVVSKKVWDGNDWVDSISTYYGETVRFNITITYYKNCEESLGAGDIKMIDELPPCLDYVGNANFDPSYIDDDLVYWNLTDDYGVFLLDTESISIEFDTEVIDYNENINHVEVTAFETGCGWSLFGEDESTINVVDPILVDKEVYDPETDEWVDELLGTVTKVVPVKFRITVTYTGYYDYELMKNMIVEGILPTCCLEYADNEIFTYPDDDNFEDPEIIVSQDLKQVTFDWTNKMFNLYAGEEIVIEFETTVVEYCYDTVENWAYVDLYNNPVQLSDSDCASVDCYPPDSTIEKTVWDPVAEEWVEEISVYIDETVTFKIELTYYGNYNLSDISIRDELHYYLEYTGIADPPEDGISGNNIWWNFTVLNDSDTITIEFDALAIGITGSGPGINTVYVTAFEDTDPFEDSDTAAVVIKTNTPSSPPDIIGDTAGVVGQVLTFHAVSWDPDGDDILYMFDWDDGTTSDWLGPKPSEEELSTTNTWDAPGTYYVKAKAKDLPLEEESFWSFFPVKVEIEPAPVPGLNVTINSGISTSINVKIENVGELELNNIAWNITVDRIGILQRVLLDKNGTIPTLPIGGKSTLTASPSGFGFFNVTVEVVAPGLDPIKLSKEGIIIWILIFL